MSESLLDNYRKQSLDTWESMAQVWAAEREFLWTVSQQVGTWLVDRVDPQPGDTILELAAGTGETGYQAARRVGDSGRVISSDFSPQMVEVARHGGEQQGLGNLEYRVIDAEHMDLGDDSVDGVICRWGYMLMADPGAALAETRRVLRPGGRLAFSVWGPPDRNPWAARPAMVLMERGAMPPPEPGAPGMFALADEDRIRALVREAGFEEPTIEQIPVDWTFDSFDQGFDFTMRMGGRLAAAMAELSEAERAEVREELRGQMVEFDSDSGYAVPGLCLNVVTQ
jgi:ubiquinone/menaquinone biosynthesis C-methylase UbiE